MVLITEKENLEEQRRRDAYFVPIERLKNNQDLFAQLAKSKFRFMALFGEDTAKPFEKIDAIVGDIVEAANSLIEDDGRQLTEEMKELLKEDKRTIGWGVSGHGKQDKIGDDINAAIAEIEGICRPILEAERPPQ